MKDCVFCKIVRQEIPAKAIYENQRFLAFRDIQPQAKDHFVVIPKEHSQDLLDASPEVLSDLLVAARGTAEAAGLAERGFRVVINTRADGGQSVFPLHAHVLGGEPLAGRFGR